MATNSELKALALFAIAYDLEREITRLNPEMKGFIAYLCNKNGFGKENIGLIKKYSVIYEDTRKELINLFEKDMPMEVVEKFNKVPKL